VGADVVVNGDAQARWNELQEKWSEVLKALSAIKKSAAILIQGQGKLLKIDSNTLLIAFENPRFVETFERSQYAGFTSSAVREVLGVSMSVRAVANGEQTAQAAAEPTPVRPTTPTPKVDQQPNTQVVAVKPTPKVSEKSPQETETAPESAELEEVETTEAEATDEVISETGVTTTSDDPFASLKEMLGATEVKDSAESA
jgi:hypothetical protein